MLRKDELHEQSPERKRPRPTVKMSLHLSPEAYEILEKLSEGNHMSKSDFLRKSIVLMQVALESKSKGEHLMVVNDKGDQREIIGL